MVARVYVSLKPQVLDPQGKAVQRGLSSMGYSEVEDARIGRYIELKIKDGADKESLRARLEEMCNRLLSNPIIENYRIEIQ
ncbi:MAG: phosphoribosylformylglycinamidine synthase subunit PurS [Myxococcota bacterium]